ncbi:hypothetical protein ACF3NA_07095 [Alkanindiges sp. WGS2144]|uniref:hypothetical protein n=1 Tax=Alkanindiges sp. WGS2144 TaxID=3366808 RepID=UPI003750AD4D
MKDSESETTDIYQQALLDSVHFSFKTTNSNIEKGGIRLNQGEALDLPYISARTLLAEGVYLPTDYQANSGKTASVFKFVKAAFLNEPSDELETQTIQDIERVKQMLPALKTQNLIAGAQYIDIRMRQLLIPEAEQQYISISPLTAAGLCYLINQEVDQVKAQVEQLVKEASVRKLKTAVLGIGGSNPQNVGSLVRAMQRPILVEAPVMNQGVRKALAIYYHGFDYHFKDCMQDFREYAFVWATESELTQQSDFPSTGINAPKTNMKVRNEGTESHPRLISEADMRLRYSELKFIRNILRSVLQQGRKHFLILQQYEDSLPAPIDGQISKWLSSSVGYVTQGLIDKDIQKREDWQHLFALQLAQRIINFKDKTEVRLLSVDDNALGFFVRLIKRMLP